MTLEPKRRGRPLKGAEAGTRVSLGLKVSAKTKALIDERARASGRTQSQEAEVWIEQASALNELGSTGPGVVDALQAMLRAALDVRNTFGDPTASVAARDELRRKWELIAANALPHVAERTADSAAKAAIALMRFAALDAFAEISAAPEHSPALAQAKNDLAKIAAGRLFPGLPAWSKAKEALEAASAESDGTNGECLALLLSAADAASRAVARAERQENERS